MSNAKLYATKCHSMVNHYYDGHGYHYHLQMVVDVANQFIHLIPLEDRQFVIDACWCHDVIEDCRETYNDVKKATSLITAEIVYAVTNEKGRTRKERANEKYYKGIRDTKYATFVKVCDRIANVKHSSDTNSRMFELYQKECSDF